MPSRAQLEERRRDAAFLFLKFSSNRPVRWEMEQKGGSCRAHVCCSLHRACISFRAPPPPSHPILSFRRWNGCSKDLSSFKPAVPREPVVRLSSMPCHRRRTWTQLSSPRSVWVPESVLPRCSALLPSSLHSCAWLWLPLSSSVACP